MSTKRLTEWFFDKYPNTMSADGCSEPGYDDKPVILANWNNIPQKVYDSLESHGFACEWEDEWLVCDNCYKAFRSSPDSYGWEMFGYIGDGFAVCGNCIEWDEYLEGMENQPRKAVTCSLFDEFKDEIESRYDLVKDDFENGFHQGQNDDPQKILNALLETDKNGRYIFVITSQGQFDIGFAVYRRQDGQDKHYWQFEGFEIELTTEQVKACSHQGECIEDVKATVKELNLQINPDLIRLELKESGAWDEQELQDDEENLNRIVWIAACNIKEEENIK